MPTCPPLVFQIKKASKIKVSKVTPLFFPWENRCFCWGVYFLQCGLLEKPQTQLTFLGLSLPCSPLKSVPCPGCRCCPLSCSPPPTSLSSCVLISKSCRTWEPGIQDQFLICPTLLFHSTERWPPWNLFIIPRALECTFWALHLYSALFLLWSVFSPFCLMKRDVPFTLTKCQLHVMLLCVPFPKGWLFSVSSWNLSALPGLVSSSLTLTSLLVTRYDF